MKNYMVYFVDNGSSDPIRHEERTIITALSVEHAQKQFVDDMLANGSNLSIVVIETLTY